MAGGQRVEVRQARGPFRRHELLSVEIAILAQQMGLIAQTEEQMG